MLMKVKTMGCVNDARHTRAPCSSPANQRRDRVMHMHDVELLAPEQRDKFFNASDMPENIKTSLDRDRFHAKAFLTNLAGKIPIRADTDNLMARLPHATHQGKKKMVEREIEVAELTDFHVFRDPGVTAFEHRTMIAT